MTTAPFGEEQADALRELANIGMGRAASALGLLLDVEVSLNIPTVTYVELTALVESINARLSHEHLVATRQAFSDGLDGEAVLVFTEGFSAEHAPVSTEHPVLVADQERLLEITNIMVGAFLGYLMEPLAVDLYFSAPTLLGLPLIAQQINRGWDYVLVLDVELGIHSRMDNCKLLLVFPETSVGQIRDAIDRLLASL